MSVGAYQANCYLVFDEQKNAVVIDPGAEPQRLLRCIGEHQLCVKAILLTHAHFDHMMAVADVQQATGAPLWLHEAEAPALSDSRRSMVPVPYPLTAQHVLCDGETFAVGNLHFTVLHTPGHTEGSVCYLCGDTLFSGDTLFAYGGVGRTDFVGGNACALWRSLKRLSSLPPNTRVATGHGEETTIAAELRKD